MWSPEYYIRYLSLPLSVEGVTIPNNDGSFDIYINSALSRNKQNLAIIHELEHIFKDHFFRQIPVASLENEANEDSEAFYKWLIAEKKRKLALMKMRRKNSEYCEEQSEEDVFLTTEVRLNSKIVQH